MRKLRFIVPILLAVIAVTAIGFSIALAQENEKDDSDVSKLAVKVANILGLDAAVVDDAIKQAHMELRDELAQAKLNALVSKGEITQEQADQFLKEIRSKPHVSPTIGNHFLAPKGSNRHWKAKGHFPGAKSRFGAKDSEEAIQRKIRTAIENGEITREEAAAKFEKLKTRKADKDK